MNDEQLLQLDFRTAVALFGRPQDDPKAGAIVLTDGFVGSSEVGRNEPFRGQHYLIVGRIAAVDGEAKTVTLRKVAKIYELGGTVPEDGQEDVTFAYLSKPIEDHLRELRELGLYYSKS